MKLFYAHLDFCYRARDLDHAKTMADEIAAFLVTNIVEGYEADVMHVGEVENTLPLLPFKGE